ncbi:MAG: DUF3791 domain-containing protein [Proteobacteria bacterium]|nr:DUF3791 domain-containing protein [Pseudomonadota bacterium]
MSDKALNNTIFLMYLVTEHYKKAHAMTTEQFLEFATKHQVLNYVRECPEIFDCLSPEEMIEEIDRYVASA